MRRLRLRDERLPFELTEGLPTQILGRLLTSLNVAVEGCQCQLYVANLPDRDDASEFQDFLEQHALWFERVDLAGGAAHATAQEDVTTGGEP